MKKWTNHKVTQWENDSMKKCDNARPDPPLPHCILTAHFVADDGAKANFLTAIRQRLKPGAPLVIVNLCGTSKDPAFAEAVRAWRRHAEVNAMPAEHLDAMVTNALALPFVSEAREHELLAAAGFTATRRIYQGLCFLGLLAFAGTPA